MQRPTEKVSLDCKLLIQRFESFCKMSSMSFFMKLPLMSTRIVCFFNREKKNPVRILMSLGF